VANTSILVAVEPVPISKPASRGTKPIDSRFVSLTLISTGSAFADFYATLFARQNWLAGKNGACNEEARKFNLPLCTALTPRSDAPMASLP